MPFIGNEDLFNSTLMKLRELGIKIEMDDFGSGYSSIGSLMKLKCNTVKIDRLFVENNLRLRTEQVFLESLIKMFKGIDLEVTVEGVENEYTVRQIRKMADNVLIQGYYFFKPMALNKFQRILDDNRFVFR
ncbi:MAG: EAL domain-containing protein [Clostridium sp.]|nr:MAG: EAL domain-containing protein [Clostridium sp.]